MTIIFVALEMCMITAGLTMLRIILEQQRRLDEEIINNEKLAGTINEIVRERKVKNGK